MAGRNIANAASYVAAHRGNVPILRLLLGLVLFGFFLLAMMLQIQTSEAFLLGGSPVKLAANWGILSQPVDLLRGVLPVDIAKAVMWGWGIELVYLVCVIGEVTIHGRLHGWFQTGAFVLVAFNFWTDVNYGSLPSGLAFTGRYFFMQPPEKAVVLPSWTACVGVW